jgi:hypothetical protein
MMMKKKKKKKSSQMEGQWAFLCPQMRGNDRTIDIMMES